MALGGTVIGTQVASTGDNGIGAETDLTITTTDGGTTGAIAYSANDSAAQIATAINSAAANIGITATATNSAHVWCGLTVQRTEADNLSGQDGVAGTAISAVVSDNNDLSAVVDAINGASASTGVTAAFTTAGDRSSITLSNSTGDDIVLDTFANSTAGNDSVDFGTQTLTEGGTVAAVAVGDVTLSSTQGQISTSNANTDVFASASDSGTFAQWLGPISQL